jgi:hypothetical protein
MQHAQLAEAKMISKASIDILPKFLNFKAGFAKYKVDSYGRVDFVGFTGSLRTATPLYSSGKEAARLATQLMCITKMDYYVIVVPAIINETKEERKVIS